MTIIGLFGSAGRMGRAISEVIAETPGAFAGPAIDREDSTDVFVAGSADVLIDFSTPSALGDHLCVAVERGMPIVIGTTGLEREHHRAIDEAARHVAILQTGNTSLGVNLLAHLVREAASRLGPDWDIEIVEMHHRHKVDAPSGTALLLGEAAAEGRRVDLARVSDCGRDGITGARKPGDIGFAALRGGSVAGDHQVIFAAEGERIELGHRAENRVIFARGAVKAALWLADKAPGRYRMGDVLGI